MNQAENMNQPAEARRALIDWNQAGTGAFCGYIAFGLTAVELGFDHPIPIIAGLLGGLATGAFTGRQQR